MQLNDQQLTFFKTFGYLAFPGLMAAEVGEIIAAFEDVFAQGGGGHHGKKHDGTQRSCIVPFIDQSPRLSALLDDARVHGILTSLLGDDFNYMGSDGNYYVGDTQWHSDGWSGDHLYLKVAFYLDELTRDTGALRVIPGSHRVGEAFAEDLQKGAFQSTKAWGIDGRDVPSVALETKPGDVVVFNHATKHGSFGGSKTRRMFTINCAQSFPESRLSELRNYIGGHARFWIDSVYGPAMLAGGGEKRRVHLRQVLANESHLPALTAKARAQAAEPSRG